jgi:hypothetical protein
LEAVPGHLGRLLAKPSAEGHERASIAKIEHQVALAVIARLVADAETLPDHRLKA